MTSNMKKFIELNKRSKIVESELLTPDKKSLSTKLDFKLCDRARYRFANGETLILTNVDKSSAPDYQPIWDL